MESQAAVVQKIAGQSQVRLEYAYSLLRSRSSASLVQYKMSLKGRWDSNTR